jgi:hypothetical protein
MMIISPFISVATTILLTAAYLNIFKESEDPDDPANPDSDKADDVFKKVISCMLPIFMLTGFCSTAGIYMITPIQEREQGLRQILTLNGMTSSRYYAGLFAADYLLYLIPMGLFVALISIF